MDKMGLATIFVSNNKLGIMRCTMAETINNSSNADDLCPECGHLFGRYRLLGYGVPPTEGWMECPIEGCTCKMTWNMNADDAPKLKTVFKPMSGQSVAAEPGAAADREGM
jgi:hypothetical protein